jgi:hypothetical protein
LIDLRLKLEQPFLCQQAAGEPNMSLLWLLPVPPWLSYHVGSTDRMGL